MQIRVEIKNLKEVQAALKKSPQVVSKHINKAINRSILDIRNEAMDTTFKHPTGRLKGSYQIHFSNLRGELYPTVKYAKWVHDGTDPYVITPVRKKALFWKGAAHPYRLVHHPGIKGNPFLQKAVDRSSNKVNKNFGDGLKDALNEIARAV